jgi:hypothetical protein
MHLHSILILLPLLGRLFFQTPPPPVLAWTAPGNVASAAEAQGLTYTLYVNSGPAVLVPGTVCVGAVAPFTCTSPVPAGVPAAINTKLELTATGATSPEGPRSTPFIQAPFAVTQFRKQ